MLLGQAWRLALPGEPARRHQPAERRAEEEERERARRVLARDHPVQDGATREDPHEHRGMRRPVAAGPVARPQAPRDDPADPGVPRGTGRRPGRPVERDRKEDRQRRNAPGERHGRERQEARGLQRHAADDPAPVRSEPPHGQRREELQHRAGEEGNARHQTRGNLSHPEGEGEGGDVGFSRPHHEARRHPVAHDGAQIAPERGVAWAAHAAPAPSRRVPAQGLGRCPNEVRPLVQIGVLRAARHLHLIHTQPTGRLVNPA